MFEEKCLKEYPPVLYWWFVQRFLDPHAWFEARTRFSLSAAVWSAVGHVIGLGDRHSENILVDTSCGDCVHVDFDWLVESFYHMNYETFDSHGCFSQYIYIYIFF